MDHKYDILKHANIKLTTDGSAEPYDHTPKSEGIASVEFDPELLKSTEIDSSDEETDFMLLTEEDVEEIFHKNKVEERKRINEEFISQKQ